MLESLKSRGGKRWPRGQKFALSAAGVSAEAAHREIVAAARSSGRSALDAAQRTWAEPLGILPADGVVLSELRAGKRSIADLAKTLDDCGVSAADVKSAVDRLTDALLVEPVPVADAAAA
jgi:hypothetical protein